MKRICALLLTAALLTGPAAAAGETAEAAQPALDLSAASAVLMEKETGTILYEQNPHDKLEPASVTKVMTLLLIMEALDAGTITKATMVPVSATAAGMGGSQVYLKEGEQMTVGELVKCITVVSGNDAAVALAEHLAGSEEAFVSLMNQRAAELGMADTCFVNCTGLPAAGHLTSAHDIAVMSRALLQHPRIRDYTTIWMDSIRGGQFQLANTNKLIRSYQGITGLKTGTTGQAGSCITATAERNGLSLIAVVLGADSTDHRFQDAAALLDYGFAGWKATVPEAPALEPVPVARGMAPTVEAQVGESPSLLLEAAETGSVETEVVLEELTAPVKAGDVIGTVRYSLGGEVLAEVDITAAGDVEAVTFASALGYLFRGLFAL